MEFSKAVDFVGCKEDEGLRPNGVLQCNFEGVSILMKSNPFLKKKIPFHCWGVRLFVIGGEWRLLKDSDLENSVPF